MWNRAITLGVKNQHRSNLLLTPLVGKVQTLMHKYNSTYYLACIEDYTTTGYHVHIYFEGPEIFWDTFNRDWGLGYVKDRQIYNKEGWFKYLKKSGCWWEEGNKYVPKKSAIERFTGESMSDYEDTVVLEDSSDDGNNLPFY